MSYDSDPARWTSSPELAPEALRKPLMAAASEGPSDLQMKTLALKLSAIAAGTAVAASAATAKAAATTAGGASAKAAGTLTLGKALASLAIVGAVGTSAVLWQHKGEPTRRTARAPEQQEPAQPVAEQAPAATRDLASPAQPTQAPVAPATPATERAEPVVEAQAERQPSASATQAQPARRAQTRGKEPARTAKSSRAELRAREQAEAQAKRTHEATLVAKSADVPSEVELLRRARAALASRPRSAFALTEEHREHYPRGVFAQERDALAVEALLRAGDMERARELARDFLRDYPASPHAHRFRESMGL
jgi:hypothetical protein